MYLRPAARVTQYTVLVQPEEQNDAKKVFTLAAYFTQRLLYNYCYINVKAGLGKQTETYNEDKRHDFFIW